jgi:hypothetical protein
MRKSPVRRRPDNASVDLDARGGVVGIEVIAIGYPLPLPEILATYDIPQQEAVDIRIYFHTKEAPDQHEPKLSTGTPAPAMVPR